MSCAVYVKVFVGMASQALDRNSSLRAWERQSRWLCSRAQTMPHRLIVVGGLDPQNWRPGYRSPTNPNPMFGCCLVVSGCNRDTTRKEAQGE
eukprot:2497452-Amphidinium_carterae.1